MAPSRLTFHAVLLLWWVILVTIAILATHLRLTAQAPAHALHKPRIPVSPAVHPGFPYNAMVKHRKLSHGCVVCHQHNIPDAGWHGGLCCAREEAGFPSRPPPPPGAARSSTASYRSSPKARVTGNPFLRRVPGLNYTQDRPFRTPDPVLSVPQPLPSQFALSPHYLRNGNLTWLTVPPPPPLPPPKDAAWAASPVLAMPQRGSLNDVQAGQPIS